MECNQNILDHQCQITDTEELLDDEELAETAHGEVVILNQKLSDLKGDLLRLMIPEDTIEEEILLWKFERVPAGMRPHYLFRIFLECMENILKNKVGRLNV